MAIGDLPALNCGLNAAAALCLLLGFAFIRRKDVPRHRACMLLAALCSLLFLVSYLVYHAKAGSRPYPGQGALRVVYFAVLISHSILAVINVPLVVLTLLNAFRDRRERHRRLARVTLPVWLYVSATGVLIYFMLYVWV